MLGFCKGAGEMCLNGVVKGGFVGAGSAFNEKF